MRKHQHFSPLLILIIGITALTSIASLTTLFLHTNANPEGGITGASIYESRDLQGETFELYEGHSTNLDINGDKITDAELQLKYSDEGLAVLEIKKYKDSC